MTVEQEIEKLNEAAKNQSKGQKILNTILLPFLINFFGLIIVMLAFPDVTKNTGAGITWAICNIPLLFISLDFRNKNIFWYTRIYYLVISIFVLIQAYNLIFN